MKEGEVKINKKNKTIRVKLNGIKPVTLPLGDWSSYRIIIDGPPITNKGEIIISTQK